LATFAAGDEDFFTGEAHGFFDAHARQHDEDFVDPTILFSPHKLKCSLLSDPATPGIFSTT
jgi:hypothetical protein